MAPPPPGTVGGAEGDEEDEAAEEERARREILERELDERSDDSLSDYREYADDDDDIDSDDGGGGGDEFNGAGGLGARAPVAGLTADADLVEGMTAPGLQHEPLHTGLHDWLKGAMASLLLALI